MADEDAARLRAAVAALMRLFLVNERRFPPAGGAARYSPHDFQSLTFIAERGEASLGALAAHLGVAATTATSVADRLVRKGLASRHVHAGDGRSRVLRPTEEGATLAKRIVAQDLVNMNAVLDALAPHERRPFVGMMARVAERLTSEAR
ncbi:MAG: MarR family transcriptional regulator [Pseudomonadota bacterium]